MRAAESELSGERDEHAVIGADVGSGRHGFRSRSADGGPPLPGRRLAMWTEFDGKARAISRRRNAASSMPCAVRSWERSTTWPGITPPEINAAFICAA